MSNIEPLLTKQEITELKARAHHLNPVVMVGQKGLTDAVIAETRQALHAHELIKVRVFGDDRMERIAICEALCAATGAQLVQHIGKRCRYGAINALPCRRLIDFNVQAAFSTPTHPPYCHVRYQPHHRYPGNLLVRRPIHAAKRANPAAF